MAHNISNSYVGNAAGNPDFTTGKTRTNPQAHETNNVVKLYGVRKIGGGTFAPTWTGAITSAGTTTTFTPTAGQNTSGLRFWKYRIIDDSGNEAYGTMNVSSPGAVAVTTSGLDPLKRWRIEFSAEVLTSNGSHDQVSWWMDIPAGLAKSNPSFSGQTV
jgi:hypothetical protein